MGLTITLSLIVGSIILGLAILVIHYARRYQGQLNQLEMLEAENEILVKQINSIVFSKSDAGRVYKELRIKHKNS